MLDGAGSSHLCRFVVVVLLFRYFVIILLMFAATHPLEAKYRKDDENYYELAKPVKIGNNCWLGGHCTIGKFL